MLRIPSRLDARRREPTSTAARMYRAASTDAVGCRAAGPWPARPGIAPRTTATTDGRPKTATDLDLLDAHGRAGALDGCGGTTKADGAPFRVWLGRCRASCSPTAPHPRTGLAVRGSVGPLVEPFPMPQPPVGYRAAPSVRRTYRSDGRSRGHGWWVVLLVAAQRSTDGGRWCGSAEMHRQRLARPALAETPRGRSRDSWAPKPCRVWPSTRPSPPATRQAPATPPASPRSAPPGARAVSGRRRRAGTPPA